MFYLPETPSWSIKNDQIDVATETVIWLFGTDHNLLSLALLQSDEDNSDDKFKLFTDRLYRRPFLLCIVVMFYQQFSGINAIIFYTSSILDSAKSTLNPNSATIYIGLVQSVAVLISCLLVDRFGRKILLIISGFFMGLAMLVFSIYYFLDDSIKIQYGSIPFIALSIFIFFFAIGFGPVPW